MFETLELDYQRYRNGKLGNVKKYVIYAIKKTEFRAVFLYRLGVWFKNHNLKYLVRFTQGLMHHTCYCWISVNADIGPGFLIAHVGGLVIGGNTRIGRNCDVRQNITFGGNFNKTSNDGRTKPWVGDNVSFGVGAVISGPVRIGSNSIIGANTVVTRDVPENVIVFGVPGQIIKERWPEESGRKL